MRFARFFFALLASAFIFIVLMKVLFFALMAVFIIGGLSWAYRAAAYRHYRHNYDSRSGQPWSREYDAWRSHATPLDPRWPVTDVPPAKPYGRRIEVY